MKKNMKGFTLIELLAVIVILAIIALIAVPLVMDVVNDAKNSAALSEANLIIQGINNYCGTEDMKYALDSTYVKKCTASGTLALGAIDNIMIDMGKATLPTMGTGCATSATTGGSLTLDANRKVTSGHILSNGIVIKITTGTAAVCV